MKKGNKKRPPGVFFGRTVSACPLNFSRPQAAGANLHGFGGSVNFCPDFSDIRLPDPVGFDVGMTHLVPGLTPFAAYFTLTGQFIYTSEDTRYIAQLVVYHRPHGTARKI